MREKVDCHLFSKKIVIFLGIEGVLFNYPVDGSIQNLMKAHRLEQQDNRSGVFSYEEYGLAAVKFFNPTAVESLATLIQVIEEAGKKVGIVISSDFRKRRDIVQLQALFRPYFFSKFIIGKTQNSQKEESRIGEIQEWLDDHSEHYENFIILDHRQNLSQYFGQRLIHCHVPALLTMTQVHTALKVLQIPVPMPETPKETKCKPEDIALEAFKGGVV